MGDYKLDLDKVIDENFKGLEDFITDKDILKFYNELIKECIEYYAQQINTPTEKVTRVEVIDENGRSYTKWNCQVEFSYQDDGRTLKLFLTKK